MTEQTQQLPDKDKGSDDQMTLAEATQILVYQDAALPVSEHVSTAATSQAAFIQKLPEGGWTIGNGSGPVTQETPQERRERIEQEQLEAMRDGLEDTQRQLKEEREREEWSNSTHSFAGADLTGEEWGELGDELGKDGKLRQWLVTRLMKDGKTTKAQAEKNADTLSLAFQGMSKPESQRSEEENAAIKKVDETPELKKVVPAVAEQFTSGTPLTAEADKSAMAGQRSASVASGGDLFASAPALTQHHQAAVAATEPLDAPKAPIRIAALEKPAPVAAASAGLDF